MPQPAALYNCRKWQLIGKSQWCGSANAAATTHTTALPPPQSTTPGIHPVSIHQMTPPGRGRKHTITDYYSVYRPRKDESLNRPGSWLQTEIIKEPPPGIEPGHVAHPSTNRARRRVTSLIRSTPLPLHHAANYCTPKPSAFFIPWDVTWSPGARCPCARPPGVKPNVAASCHSSFIIIIITWYI